MPSFNIPWLPPVPTANIEGYTCSLCDTDIAISDLAITSCHHKAHWPCLLKLWTSSNGKDLKCHECSEEPQGTYLRFFEYCTGEWYSLNTLAVRVSFPQVCRGHPDLERKYVPRFCNLDIYWILERKPSPPMLFNPLYRYHPTTICIQRVDPTTSSTDLVNDLCPNIIDEVINRFGTHFKYNENQGLYIEDVEIDDSEYGSIEEGESGSEKRMTTPESESESEASFGDDSDNTSRVEAGTPPTSDAVHFNDTIEAEESCRSSLSPQGLLRTYKKERKRARSGSSSNSSYSPVWGARRVFERNDRVDNAEAWAMLTEAERQIHLQGPGL